MLSRLTEREFTIWLAGFFDGEGCVYLKDMRKLPRIQCVDATVANTKKRIIYAIGGRLGYGTIHNQKQRDHWARKYVWRVRRADDVVKFLNRILPYLTIKAKAARLGVIRASKTLNRRHETRNRNAIVFKMSKSMTHQAVAVKMGMTRSNVQLIDSWIRRHGNVPMPSSAIAKRRRALRKARSQ